MPDENDLKNMFDSASAPNTLDIDRIVRKSRRARLPKQIVAGSAGALAIAGLFVLGINTTQLTAPPVAISAQDSSMGSEAAPSTEAALKRAPADKLNLCGGTLADVAPSNYGLQLQVTFGSTAAVGTAPIEGTVTLTNTSDQRIAGTTARSPAITVSQNGIVMWHSNGPMFMSLTIVDLEPGQSLSYPASFTPVLCGVEDDSAETFRAYLPALPAGDYELSAAIDFSVDPSMASSDIPDQDLVTGPTSPLTLTD